MEIKIRAWDTETKEMSYDYLAKNWLRVAIESPFVRAMLYIGCQDKNNKDVYVGDIFPPTERTHGQVTIVCYDTHQCRYKAVPSSLYKLNAGNGGWTGFDINPYSEVIGNIYENPDLLAIGGNE